MIFVHTSIRTSNMDKSIDFYTKLIGLKLLGRHEIQQNNAEIAFLQDPEKKGSQLELTHYRKQKKFIQADYENRLSTMKIDCSTTLHSTLKTWKKP